MSKINILALVLILLLTTKLTSAQKPNLDSLYFLWQDPKQTDSIRSTAFSDYIKKGFLFSNPDSAEILADKLISFGKTKAYPNAQALGFTIKGISFSIKGEVEKGLNFFTRSLKIYETIGNQAGIASSLGNIGNLYENLGDYQKALDNYAQSLKINQDLDNQKGIATNLYNIGLVFEDQGNYSRALENFMKSLKIYEQLGDKMGISNTLNTIAGIFQIQNEYTKAIDYLSRTLKIYEQLDNQQGIANTYNNIGIIYKKKGDYIKSLDYYTRGLMSYEKMRNQRGIALSLNNIGLIYEAQNKYSEALDYFTQSLKIREQLNDQEGMAGSYVNIGSIYEAQNKYSEALIYCKNGYELALIVGILEQQKKACLCLYNTYKATGKPSQALVYYEKAILIRDSIYNKENTKKLTQLEMQYDFDKKETLAKSEQKKKDAITIEELRRQKLLRNGFIVGFVMVMMFAGIFWTQRNRISKEKKRSEELLLNILPVETAKELKEKGHTEAQLIDKVTVLFTDFKGFTAMSEKVTPKELVADLHACFSEFDRICEKYGIEKIKTIGDAYMAAGGLPTPNSTHAYDVVHAALEMAMVVQKGMAKKIEEGSPFFEVRIGVHTGPVVAGIVGLKKFQYDIWGDTVNTASRMESSSEVGNVNISETTYELLKDNKDFVFVKRGKIAVKGKGELEMYFVRLSENQLIENS